MFILLSKHNSLISREFADCSNFFIVKSQAKHIFALSMLALKSSSMMGMIGLAHAKLSKTKFVLSADALNAYVNSWLPDRKPTRVLKTLQAASYLTPSTLGWSRRVKWVSLEWVWAKWMKRP